jgi:hypothetical protein
MASPALDPDDADLTPPPTDLDTIPQWMFPGHLEHVTLAHSG